MKEKNNVVNIADGDVFPRPIIFMRHGEDEPILTVEMDAKIRADKVNETYLTALEITQLCQNRGFSSVKIIGSPKTRVMETALILKEVLGNRNIDCDLTKEPLIEELNHGVFDIDPDLIVNCQYRPLWVAYQAFQAAMKSGDIHYRFGDPICNSYEGPTSELQRYFLSFGENQVEFSKRVYRFLIDLNKIDPSQLHIVVTHQAITNRTQRIIDSALKNASKYQKGLFIRKLEREGERISICYAEAIILPLDLIRMSANCVLKSELEYLEASEV